MRMTIPISAEIRDYDNRIDINIRVGEIAYYALELTPEGIVRIGGLPKGLPLPTDDQGRLILAKGDED